MTDMDRHDVPLPTKIDIGKGSKTMTVTVDKLKPEHLEEAKKTYTEAARTGNHVGLDEFHDYEIDNRFAKGMQHNMTGGWAVLGFTTQDDQFVAVFFLYPSHMLRSSYPVHSTGYMGVQEKYQGWGLGSHPIMSALIWVLVRSQGYVGYLAKTSVLGKGIPSAISIQRGVLGVIPQSLYMRRFGRVADLVMFNVLSSKGRREAEEILKEKEARLQQLKLSPLTLQGSFQNLNKVINIKEKKHFADETKEIITIKCAKSQKDVIDVEKLIRAAAERGDEFGIDEFNENGFFNRHLLRHSHVIMAVMSDGSIAGGAIFGPSMLTRSVTTTTLAVYIVTGKCPFSTELKRSLLQYISDWAVSEGYDTMLLDIYQSDKTMQGIVETMGFVCVGTLPHSGYIRGRGLTHCYMYHKYLVPINQAGFGSKTHVAKL